MNNESKADDISDTVKTIIDAEKAPRSAAVLDKDFALKQPEAVVAISKHQLIYSTIGLILSGLFLLGGAVLFISGVTGSSTFVAKALGNQLQMTDAPPGAILCVLGVCSLLATRYQFEIKKGK